VSPYQNKAGGEEPGKWKRSGVTIHLLKAKSLRVRSERRERKSCEKRGKIREGAVLLLNQMNCPGRSQDRDAKWDIILWCSVGKRLPAERAAKGVGLNKSWTYRERGRGYSGRFRAPALSVEDILKKMAGGLPKLGSFNLSYRPRNLGDAAKCENGGKSRYLAKEPDSTTKWEEKNVGEISTDE